jgi:homoserine O-acetyltransferase
MSSSDPTAAALLPPPRATFIDPTTRVWSVPRPFPLELGGALHGVQVAYRTWGKLDASGENAVVVCHALTGSADVDRWWTRMFGPGRALDPDRDFIVCSNILGSCYGTTGPASADPAAGRPYLGAFPAITIRDMVRLQRELVAALGVRRVRLVVGGSLGGMQTLEWALMYPELVDAMVPIACSGRHSAWAIGLSEAQRQAIQADPLWAGGQYDPEAPPASGLAAARMMAMCMYRSRPSFEQRFGRRAQKADLYAVESYLRYQGQQLVDRFDTASYVALTRAMDTHDLARGRGDYDDVLRAVRKPTLVVSIDTDVLYYPEEQRELAELIPDARFARLASPHGHDAFLIEVDELSDLVADFRGGAGGAARARAPAEPAYAHQAVSLFVLGAGQVGSALLEQVREQRAALERDYDVRVRVVGVAESRRAVFDADGLDLGRWRELLAAAPEASPFPPGGGAELLDQLAALPSPVLVDVTAADGMESVYEEAFRRGIHVVGANKRPLAVDLERRQQLSAAARQHGRHYHYETTVGASLPVIDTLKNLVRTGDRVQLIEGSLSGTANFVCSEAMRGAPLSLAVRWAKELGYTEPDPRDDLSGLDTARKAVILARELGLQVSLSDVRREPLLPPELLAPGSLQDLYEALRRHDAAFAARVDQARREGRALRYLARIAVGPGSTDIEVRPALVDPEHRAARLRGVEAFVAFTTERYREHPLVVQGAGVGGAVTAGGVLADVLKVVPVHGAA